MDTSLVYKDNCRPASYLERYCLKKGRQREKGKEERGEREGRGEDSVEKSKDLKRYLMSSMLIWLVWLAVRQVKFRVITISY